MGHIGRDGLATLSRRLGIKFSESFICEVCQLSKKKQKSYPRSMSRAERPGELLHLDVCGPFKFASFDRSQYFAVIRDHHTRYLWVQLMKTRDKLAAFVMQACKYLETHTGCRVKPIRSDNARELLLSEFGDFMQQNGIQDEKSIAYAHPQNGRAENVIQVLQRLTRSMLIESKLGYRY